MKKFVTGLLFGNDTVSNGLVALAIIAAIALGCACPKDLANSGESNTSNTSERPSNSAPAPKADASTGQVPSEAQLQDITRATLLDFNDAIQSGSFTNFHRNVSKPFQKQASVEKMETAFKQFIDAKIDLSEIRTLPATFSSSSVQKISGVNHLLVSGSYNTSPRPAQFDLKYIPEGKDWKLISIEVNTKNERSTTN